MNYEPHYNVAAIIICTVILTTHLIKRKTKEKYNLVFTLFILATIAGAFLNIISTECNLNYGKTGGPVLYGLNYAFFYMLSIPTFLFQLYAVLLVKSSLRNVSLITKLLIFLPLTAAIILVSSNPWTDAAFRFVDGKYTRGKYQIVLYIINFFYTIYGAAYVVTAGDNIRRSTKAYVCISLGMALLAAVIQFFIPGLLLQFFGIALGELVIFLNVQKTDDYVNPEIDIFNKMILLKIVRQDMEAGRRLRLLFIHLEDLSFIMDNFGTDSRKQLLAGVAEFLNGLTGCNAYYFGGGTFVILGEWDSEKFTGYEKAVRKALDERWKVSGTELHINYKMMYCNMPEHINDVPGFYYVESLFSGMTPDASGLVRIEDIDFGNAKKNIEMEQLIKRAIDNDYFQVYFQPIYSVEDEKIVSAEALIRLIDPECGFVPPGDFIPVAEKNGTIIKVGEIVFKKVFEFMRKNDIRSMGIEYIEINLSVVQCMQREMADNLIRMMREYEIDEKMINLEITETAVADSHKMLIENINTLGSRGISFSMDDFGTGYSNICALIALPLDIIKFDKSIIDMASGNGQGYKVLESSVTMVKKLGNKIVAEGIEEAPQVDMMKNLGIDYIQGYYFSKPLPADSFLDYVKKFNAS